MTCKDSTAIRAETVRDYLGHPCDIAKAMDYFDEPLDEARKLEPRELARQIGIRLNEINARITQPGAALQLVHDSLPITDEDDQTRAVLAMTIAYDTHTCNEFWHLAGYVLAALERGGLVQARAEGGGA